MARPSMARLVLALLLLWSLSAVNLLRAESACADDGCGCPHEAPSASCCCDAPPAAARPARPLERAVVLAELRGGRLGGGPCLVDGGCRGARRARAQARPGAPACPPGAVPRHALPLPSAAPSAKLAPLPEPLEPEPSIPPPRRRRAN